MPSLSRVIARLVPGSTAFNTLATPPPVPIHFHKSPDFGSGARGIEGLDFEVEVQGAIIAQGTTGADGKVDVRVPPDGSATLRILVNGTAVSEYTVTIDTSPLSSMTGGDAILDPGSKAQAANETANGTAIRGTQERLRMLGYHIGHDGPDGNGVTGLLSTEWERSVLDFQVDQDLLADAKVGAQTRSRLTGRAGG